MSARKWHNDPSTTRMWKIWWLWPTKSNLPGIRVSGIPVSYTHLDVYKRQLYLLLNTFHCSSIDKSIVDKWLAFSEQVDIRVFLYLCGIQTFGDLWVPHGLINFISETRSLKLNNKIENYLEILSHARQIIQSDKRNDIKDLENVLRSLDLSIVRKCVQEDCNVCLLYTSRCV